jgi:hypothetical protein
MKKQRRILIDYLNGLSSSPEQRTPEWYRIRKTTIGGSEIATILGLNPFSSKENMIAGKIGITYFNGNLATRWGTLFEQVTQKWSEMIFKIDDGIKEAGSIEGIIAGQRYSPDGIGIVKLLNSDNEEEYYIILFEFKAPLGSLPNGKIPKHYYPQIQTGLISIPITDYGIFVNNCYRKCGLSDLGFNGTYDKEFHLGDYKKRTNGMSKETPFAYGIICFYQTIEDYYKLYDYLGYGADSDCEEEVNWDSVFAATDIPTRFNNTNGDDRFYIEGDTELLLDSKDSLIDFGESSKSTMNRLLELYTDKRIKPIYYPIIMNTDKVNDMDLIYTHSIIHTNATTNTTNATNNATTNATNATNNATTNKANNTDSPIVCPCDIVKSHIEQFKSYCRDEKMCGIGYLPWKLMRSDVILVGRENGWKEKIEAPINELIKELTEINKAEDPEKEYLKRYPSTDDVSLEHMAEMTAGL